MKIIVGAIRVIIIYAMFALVLSMHAKAFKYEIPILLPSLIAGLIGFGFFKSNNK